MIAWAGVVIVAALLFYEHSIVSPGNLIRMNAAFSLWMALSPLSSLYSLQRIFWQDNRV